MLSRLPHSQANTWAESLDERLIDYEPGKDLDGWVWGVRWQLVHPGLRLVEDSILAQEWSDRLGMTMCEARMETSGRNLVLIFADLKALPAEMGTAPFVVPPNRPTSSIRLPDIG